MDAVVWAPQVWVVRVKVGKRPVLTNGSKLFCKLMSVECGGTEWSLGDPVRKKPTRGGDEVADAVNSW